MAVDEKSDEARVLREELAKVRADIAALAKDLRDLGVAAAGTAQRAAEAEGERLKTGIDDTLDELRRRGEKTLHDAKATVEERPLFAVLVALMVGFVLGRMLDRR
jgi:ElaB/YqjD/DUF883 family membrane-anchored ribosome-binding protein